jgi:hypothetical protein
MQRLIMRHGRDHGVRLVHPEDNVKLNSWLEREITNTTKDWESMFDNWTPLEQESFYNNLCDGVQSLTLIHSCVCLHEVQSILLDDWENGKQCHPLNSKYSFHFISWIAFKLILFPEEDLDAVAVTLFTKDVIVVGKNNEIVYVNIPKHLQPISIEIAVVITSTPPLTAERNIQTGWEVSFRGAPFARRPT